MEDPILWKKLFRTIEMIRNYNARVCRAKRPRKDITITQVQIISCVLFAPDQKVRVRDIADELGLTPGAVSQQVDRLVKMDFLDRKTDENDRRAVSITLSENGMELNRELEVFFSTLFDRLLAGVSDQNLEVFSGILDVMQKRVAQERDDFIKNNRKEELR